VDDEEAEAGASAAGDGATKRRVRRSASAIRGGLPAPGAPARPPPLYAPAPGGNPGTGRRRRRVSEHRRREAGGEASAMAWPPLPLCCARSPLLRRGRAGGGCGGDGAWLTDGRRRGWGEFFSFR
jgi:hypothetical protein